MRRAILAVAVLIAASTVAASDRGFRLTVGRRFRRPIDTPVRCRASSPEANGVTPPYQRPADPGVLGNDPVAVARRLHRPARQRIRRADQQRRLRHRLLRVTPRFKTRGDGTTSRGPVNVLRFTPFSDPNGLLDAVVHHGRTRLRRASTTTRLAADRRGSGDQERPAPHRCRLRRRVDRADGRRHVLGGRGVRAIPAALRRARPTARAPVRHPVLRAPQNPQNTAEPCESAELARLRVHDAERRRHASST